MIELTTSLTPTTGSASVPAAQPAAPGATASAPGGFVLALGAYLDASTPPSGTTQTAVTPRQDDADDGKNVPRDADPNDDTDSGGALMWFPGLAALGVVTPPAANVATMETGGQDGNLSILGGLPDAAAPLGGAGNIRAFVGLSKGGPATAPVAALDMVPTPTDTGMSAPAAPVTILASGAPAAAAADASAPPQPAASTDARLQPPATAPVVALPAGASQPTNSVQPARQAFATALGAMLATPKRLRADGDDTTTAPLLAADATQFANGNVVKSAGDTQQAPLDLRQDRGIGQMIDHIEALRDDANANDTRIRLVPDVLGTIDVAVRKQGDAVHVHFTAQSDATRAVIADAQPRLTEIAGARGVRISGTSIDSGTGSGGHAKPQPRPESTRPAPASAASRKASAADTDPITGQRLA